MLRGLTDTETEEYVLTILRRTKDVCERESNLVLEQRSPIEVNNQYILPELPGNTQNLILLGW